ncbi:MAG: c-type cytochrome [Proteobacteria bacterium]|nr:c-type cytochrome [Pseudomonadota bacterium]MCP4920221.1 c-type cytochrome [Pseudomonadota bacterium]
MAVTPHHKHTAVFLAIGAGLVGYTAWAFTNYELFPAPMQGRQLWFTDMMDAVSVKAFEREMAPLPEGVISQNMYVENFDRNTPDGQALTHDYTVDEAFLGQGETMFLTYCAPCHNADALGSGPVTDGSKGARYPIPGLPLAGDAAISKLRTDGYIYLTIRNGSAIMPAHGWAMDDNEMWSVVEYIRTLDGAQYVPPTPPSEEG